MVIDDVIDDSDPVIVRRVDKTAQCMGAAVALLDGKDVRRVVTPRDIAGEFVGRQELDGVDPQVLQISQLGDAAITNTCSFPVEVVYCYKGGRGGTFDCPSPPRRMRADSLRPGATHPLPEYKRGSNNGIALVARKGEIGTVMPQLNAGGKTGCQ